MCNLTFHNCYCGKTYPCPYPNWVCPTLNGDEDGNMCDECLDKMAAEMEEWERNSDV